jgi:hypothetical protein
MRHISTAIAALLAVYCMTAAARASHQGIVRHAELPVIAAISEAG